MTDIAEGGAEAAAEAAAAAPPPKGLRLLPPAASRWIDFPEHPGVRMLVKPLTSPLNIAAEARARRRLKDALKGDPDHPAHTDADVGTGLMFTFQAEALGCHLIEAWEGVLDMHDAPLPVTEDAIAAVMQHPDISRTFVLEARRPLDELAAEGNASGPTPNGSSAMGPTIAPAAGPMDATPAPPGSPSH